MEFTDTTCIQRLPSKLVTFSSRKQKKCRHIRTSRAASSPHHKVFCQAGWAHGDFTVSATEQCPCRRPNRLSLSLPHDMQIRRQSGERRHRQRRRGVGGGCRAVQAPGLGHGRGVACMLRREFEACRPSAAASEASEVPRDNGCPPAVSAASRAHPPPQAARPLCCCCSGLPGDRATLGLVCGSGTFPGSRSDDEQNHHPLMESAIPAVCRVRSWE